MSFSGRLSGTDLQTSAFSRRSVLGKLFATAVAMIATKRSPELLVSKNYPLPEFKIGDLVASDWVDEFDEEVTDFGEVAGLCYLPNCKSFFRERNCLSVDSWAYQVYWTHSTSGCDVSYPCFDGELVSVEELRLVS